MRTPLPAIRARAASTSASVGVVSVAKLENLFHDLSNSGERVQFSLLDLVEEPPELRIVLDGALAMRLGAGRRDREHLAGEILAAPLVEQPFFDQEGSVLLDLVPEIADALAVHGLRQDDRRLPGALLVERQDRAHLAQ